MDELDRSEYRSLRATIQQRGSVRTITFLATMIGWAALLLTALLSTAESPFVLLLPLLVLAAGFEAVLQIHIGVERVGRYVQVAYEERRGAAGGDSGAAVAGWETTAMSYGRAYRSAGSDSLFSPMFLLADGVNVLWLLFGTGNPFGSFGPAVLAVHVVFGARVVLARRSAARQRAEDLVRFRALLARGPETDHSSGGGSR